ncbi:MAG: DUF4383 domain-containing protein [Patescibacteria group bacterium]
MEEKKWTKIFGWVLVIIGVLGFVPGITSNGMLLGIFAVNGLHSIVHITTGALFIWAAGKDENTAKMYFKVFGIIYAAIAILGLFGSGYVLGVLYNNIADTILHIVIAVCALYMGFGGKKAGTITNAPSQTV